MGCGAACPSRITRGCASARPSTGPLRELALSYFEGYYNPRGERTLRAYSGPVNLSRFDRVNWMTSEDDLWCVPEYLAAVRHYPLFPDRVARALPKLDRRSYEAGLHGSVRH